MEAPIRIMRTQWLGMAPEGLLLLGSIEEKAEQLRRDYAGSFQMLYLDPPFNTGKRYEAKLSAGTDAVAKGLSNVTLEAYNDRWPSREAYLSALRDVLVLAKDLLRPDGTIFLHCDGHMNAHLRLLMDDVFGESCFLNEIVWSYQSGGRSRTTFPRKHDTILFYSRGKKYKFDLRAVPVGTVSSRSNHMRRDVDEDGRTYRMIRSAGKEYRYYDDEPVYADDVWNDIGHLQQRDPERTGFETQKPIALLRRILACASDEGDLVGDLFSGSGTTAAAAAEMNRRFVALDRSEISISLAEKRLLGQAGKPKSGYALEADCCMDGAADCAVYPAIMTYTVFLSDFVCPGAPEGLPGLEAADRWSAGFLRDGVFYACAASVRTKKKPGLAPSLEMPVYGGEPCVMITDYRGRRHFFLPARRV